MADRPIAIVGSVDPTRDDYDRPLKNPESAPAACKALGRAIAEAGHPILVFGSSPKFIEADLVDGYLSSGKAREKSIRSLYPRDQDPEIHNDFPAQAVQPDLFDPRIDEHPRWEVSYYQSLPDVEGVLLMGGGRATLILGLMALAARKPVVSLATFGGNAEEIWAMLPTKPWIDAGDRQAMGQQSWTDERAAQLVASFERQRGNLEAEEQNRQQAEERRRQDRRRRTVWAFVLGLLAAALTGLGVFGDPEVLGTAWWVSLYAISFLAIPVAAGMAGALFLSLRRRSVSPPPMGETLAHGFWSGLISALLFFLSQVTTNPSIDQLRDAVELGTAGLDILLIFSLVIAFIAGLTYEAVFARWESVDVSRTKMLDPR